MLNLALIVGLWATTCIQSQTSQFTGFVIESYEVAENGDYEFRREWFADPVCSQPYGEETESGVVKVGKKLSGVFVSGKTFEVDFETTLGRDLGAVRVEDRSLRFARGMRGSNMRNTMVGLFNYSRR